MKDELSVKVQGTNDLTFNVQADLDFTLIGTKLKMAFSKIGGENAFVILPGELQTTEGMTIGEMVDAINQFGKDYDPSMTSDLTKDKVEGAVTDVSTAAAKKSGNDADIQAIADSLDFNKIKDSAETGLLAAYDRTPAGVCAGDRCNAGRCVSKTDFY